MSALNGLQKPSLEALTPRFVDKEDLPAAAALGVFRGSVGMIAGPALGGLLIASAGLTATYVVDFASYAFSLACFAFIRRVPPPEGPRRASRILEGLHMRAGRS
jgi:predicted MFS family arabinose efflux permease